jgi:hypothetical protein
VANHDEPGYYAKHRAFLRKYGSAKNRECVQCGRQAYDNTTLHGHEDVEHPEPWTDMVPMCRKCHNAYDELGRKSSEALKGRRASAEAKRAMSDGLKRYYTENPEASRKRAEAIKRAMSRPDVKQKLSESNSRAARIRARTPEARQRMSEIQKARWADPEYRRRQLDGIRRYHEQKQAANG